MERPVIYYVDDEIQVLDAIRKQLSGRYAADYEVRGEQSPGAALRELEQLKEFRPGGGNPAGRLLYARNERAGISGAGAQPVSRRPARFNGGLGGGYRLGVDFECHGKQQH